MTNSGSLGVHDVGMGRLSCGDGGNGGEHQESCREGGKVKTHRNGSSEVIGSLYGVENITGFDILIS